MIRVLFVCLGNICRSPMAEAIFAKRVQDAGLGDQIEADSAGTGHWHIGNPAHEGTLKVLREHKIPYNGRARLLMREDLDRFDYVVPMDNQNLQNIQGLGVGRAVVAPMLSYAPHLNRNEVPDPYFDGKFETVYALLSESVDALLAQIRSEHRL